jgi:hypothetical protein
MSNETLSPCEDRVLGLMGALNREMARLKDIGKELENVPYGDEVDMNFSSGDGVDLTSCLHSTRYVRCLRALGRKQKSGPLYVLVTLDLSQVCLLMSYLSECRDDDLPEGVMEIFEDGMSREILTFAQEYING